MVEVEICVDSIESGLNAFQGGCSRIELCSALSEGGLTPTPALLRALKKSVTVPIFCMVRCRGGPMVFSKEEVALMVEEAADLVHAGADGLVYGAITPQGTIDVDSCANIKNVAGSLPVTFHRAFDVLPDPLQRLEEVISLGYNRILTSGCASSALEGRDVIKQLQEASRGRCGMMAGAGVKSSNVTQLITDTAVTMVHGSARVCRKESASGSVRMGAGDDSERWVTDYQEVKSIVAAAEAACLPK